MNAETQRARDFAIRAHGDQRYGTHPYSYHLDAVALLAAPFGERAEIAAYLHDTVEDCAVSIEEIAEAFGPEIADCVALVTDESGHNRSTRKAKTNEKLRASDNSLALIVKAADRLANLRESQRDSASGKLSMYRREHAAFKNAAYRPGICDALWEQMESIVSAEQTRLAD